MMKLSAKEMLNKFSNNDAHSLEVKRLALMIFDETNEKVLEMPARYREYLEAAALLHDIGYYIDEKGHNKHSMNMIIEYGLEGFTELEEKIIGCICRYHRGGLPDKNEHEVYNTFEKKDRKTVKRLAGILKIADGLARGTTSMIDKVFINFEEDNKIVEFIVIPKVEEFLPDISSAIRKRDLYEIGFKCQSVIKFALI
mgnify:CR=1 FL=1